VPVDSTFPAGFRSEFWDCTSSVFGGDQFDLGAGILQCLRRLLVLDAFHAVGARIASIGRELCSHRPPEFIRG